MLGFADLGTSSLIDKRLALRLYYRPFFHDTHSAIRKVLRQKHLTIVMSVEIGANMTDNNSLDPSVLRLAGGISDALDKGHSKQDIIAELIEEGMPREVAGRFVQHVDEARNKGISSFGTDRFSEVKAYCREAGLLLISAIGLFLIAVVLSIVLGVIDHILDSIGLSGIGAVLTKVGEMLAGGGLGAAATVVASESGSIGVLAGCWIGVICYYLWLFDQLPI